MHGGTVAWEMRWGGKGRQGTSTQPGAPSQPPPSLQRLFEAPARHASSARGAKASESATEYMHLRAPRSNQTVVQKPPAFEQPDANRCRLLLL